MTLPFRLPLTAVPVTPVFAAGKTLDEFPVSPVTMVPGTKIPLVLPDDKERLDVTAYLAHQSKPTLSTTIKATFAPFQY
jgi:hypothetical protein